MHNRVIDCLWSKGHLKQIPGQLSTACRICHFHRFLVITHAILGWSLLSVQGKEVCFGAYDGNRWLVAGKC